jgi:archaeosortase B (VPXXXP-CTERM-specific)
LISAGRVTMKKDRKLKGSRKQKAAEKVSVPSIGLKVHVVSFLEKNKTVLRFVGPYLFYIALFTGIYVIFQDRFVFLSTLTASTLSGIMSLLGVESYSYGQSVYMDGISVLVIDECTGIYELLVYAGCVLAYPTTLRNKFMGLVLGVPAMLIINMFRLIFLSFIGILYPSLFSYMHYYLWQITFIFLIVMLMLLWIEKIVKAGLFEQHKVN